MHFRAEVSSNDIGITDETTSDPQPFTLGAEAYVGLRLWQLDPLRASDVSAIASSQSTIVVL